MFLYAINFSFGKLFLMNMELIQLVPTMVIVIYNWKESMFITMKQQVKATYFN